jgi:hypothetical protein
MAFEFAAYLPFVSESTAGEGLAEYSDRSYGINGLLALGCACIPFDRVHPGVLKCRRRRVSHPLVLHAFAAH